MNDNTPNSTALISAWREHIGLATEHEDSTEWEGFSYAGPVLVCARCQYPIDIPELRWFRVNHAPVETIVASTIPCDGAVLPAVPAS